MPFKDPQALRDYQRAYVARRRSDFLAGKVCVDCGSTDQLEIDHVDPAEKIDHRLWSWAEGRRLAELAKCVVRCRDCHISKHAAERRQEHGLGAYKRRGCRCDVCRAAKAAAERRWRARRARKEARA
jgi:5-methylcytosine-specific restriction endonuclease McrA